MRPIYIQPSWPNKLGQLIKDLLHGQNKQYKFGDVKLCSQLKHITSKSMGNWNKTAHKYLIVIDILCMNEFLPKKNEPSFAKKKCSCCQIIKHYRN